MTLLNPKNLSPPESARRAWAAALLLQRPALLNRFQSAYAQLMALPRNVRRRLTADRGQHATSGGGRPSAVGGRRKALAATALLLALSASPLLTPRVHAATISVGGSCSLVDAIRSANADASYGTCTAGSGDDTISLTGNVTLTSSYGYYNGDTGLPLIASTITIDGNGFTISRDGAAPKFRLMAVDYDEHLTLYDVTLSGGSAYYSRGGAIYLYSNADLTVTDSTLSDNDSDYRGGAIFGEDENVVAITGSTLSNNDSGDGGGAVGLSDSGTLTISNSILSGNESKFDGGAVFVDTGDVTITDSTLTGNTSDRYGGAVLVDDAYLTIGRSVLTDNWAYQDGGAIYGRYYSEIEITDSTLSGNSAEDDGGAITVYFSTLTVTASTISGNEANDDGGGINAFESDVYLVNTTVSGNTTDEYGGGVRSRYGDLSIVNSTITGNSADYGGGGIAVRGYNLAIRYSIVSGNTSDGRGEEVDTAYAYLTTAYNVFGHDAISNADAFYGLTPAASDFVGTSDGDGAGPDTPTALGDILATTLSSNGGRTRSHALADGSPAIDFVASAACAAAPVNGVDQRGLPRNVDRPGVGSDTTNLCDAGAVEDQDIAAELFVSTSTAGVTDDAVAFGPHDILLWDGANWSKWFDGDAAGLTPNGKAKHNVNAIWIPDPNEDTVYMSFAQNARFVPGITGKVDGMDIVRWSSVDGFELAFDGQDVGLTNKSQEKIDAFHALDGSLSPVGGSCIAYLLISTQGPGQVPGAGGPIKFSGEDVLGFCLINDGAATTGVWHKLIDGSDEGMPKNSTASLSASEDGQTLYITTKGAFNVDAASGGHSMVYEFDLLTGTFSGPVFVAADEGLHQFVDALNY